MDDDALRRTLLLPELGELVGCGCSMIFESS
jgi:hypothetical protein